MKKIFCIILCFVLFTSVPLNVFAEESDSFDEIGLTEDWQEVDSEEICDEIEYTCFEEITDPSLGEYISSDDGNSGNLIQPFSIVDQNEDTDVTIQLSGLTSSNIINGTSGNDLKVLVDKTQLYQLINSKYGSDVKPVLEGSCTDGTYLYYVVVVRSTLSNDTNNDIGRGVLCLEFDSQGELNLVCSRFDSDYPDLELICHGNDITFNSLTNKLVFECGSTDYGNRCALANVAFFRGTTNNLSISQKYVSCKFSTIEYNEKLNRYIVNVTGNQSMFCYLDSNFNLIGVVNKDDLSEDAYHQGTYCNNDYICSAYTIKSSESSNNSFNQRNVIVVRDWYGNLVKEINIKIPIYRVYSSEIKYEIEGISMISNKVIAAFNCSYEDNNGISKVSTYYCDLSGFFFNIRYCQDSNVNSYINNENLPFTNIFYGVSTKLRANTFIKSGYEFKGWNIYNIDTNKWMYQNTSNGTFGWYYENQQPSGYVKRIVNDGGSLQQTAVAGTRLLLCATWQTTNKFFVSFRSPGSPESMNSISVTYGTPTQIQNNIFTKSNSNYSFTGWNIYNAEKAEWLYTCTDGEKAWYKEGQQPIGAIKTTYGNGTTISKTAASGQHLVFYARWNDFIIYYSSHDKIVKAPSILTPTKVIYGVNTTVKKYTNNDISNRLPNETFKGYLQYRADDRTWKYVNKTNSSDIVWLKSSEYDPNIYRYYVYTGTTVARTCAIGRKLVFRAKWN